tara:strand:- start:4469 stop:6118 length:1650 start_codon:yes stop_codon:yes gene_type:complete
MISKTLINNIKKYFIFFVFLVIGSLIFKDYGFNIDEKFHRLNGFYWLNYIAQYLNLSNLADLSEEKLNTIYGFTLSDINFYNKYGIVFDVPAALLEIFFKIETPLGFYQLRHFLVFLYFILGLIFFYKIVSQRFGNENIAILSVVLFFMIPRVFGDSFQNTKDIVFMTFMIISIYFALESIKISTKKNIILFSLFAAITTSLRMFGLCLLITFILVQLVSIKKNNIKQIILNSFLSLILFIIFLIIVWPLLWENTLSNFLSYFEILDSYFNSKVFFLGNFYRSDLLPYTYLPFWILISTPILHLLLFTFGLIVVSKRVFYRVLEIKENTFFPDFWRSKSEAQDFYIFINFLLLFLGLIFLNIKFYNSWRIAYFLYFFIIYFSAYTLYIFTFKKKTSFLKSLLSKSIILVLFVFTIYRIFLYHPYQSYYFNFLVTDKIKNNVEVDYTGLSAIHFLNETIENEYRNKKIKIGVASWYPLWRMLELTNEKSEDKITIIGNKDNFYADYIYTNRISDVDTNFNKKYDIPPNFIKFKELIIDGAIIYEVYKRSK